MSGLVGGFVVVIFVSLLAFETVRVLLVTQRALYQRSGVVKSYPEIASSLLGRGWSPVVKVATCISCLGSCTSYVIIFGELCGQIFQVPYTTAILAALIPLVLLSWIRTFRELSLFTLIGVLAITGSVMLVMLDGSSNYTGDEHTPLILPKRIMNYIGPATFTFTIHYCVLSMGSEVLLENPFQALNSTAAALVEGRDRRPSIVLFGNNVDSVAANTSNAMYHHHRVPSEGAEMTFLRLITGVLLGFDDHKATNNGNNSSSSTNNGTSSESSGRTTMADDESLESGMTTNSPPSPCSVNSSPKFNEQQNHPSVIPTTPTHNADTTRLMVPRYSKVKYRHFAPLETSASSAASETDHLLINRPRGLSSSSTIPVNGPNTNDDQYNDIERDVSNNNNDTNNFMTLFNSCVDTTSTGNASPVSDLDIRDDMNGALPNDPITRPLAIAYILSSILISLTGAAGFILYQNAPYVMDDRGDIEAGCEDHVCQNIILNIHKGPLRTVVGLALCTAIILSYSVMLVPAREHIENTVVRCMKPEAEACQVWTRNLLRTALVTLTAGIAISTPYFGSVLGTVGGLTDALQAFVLPPLILIQAQKTKMSWSHKFFYRCICLWGIFTMLFTFITLMNDVRKAFRLTAV